MFAGEYYYNYTWSVTMFSPVREECPREECLLFWINVIITDCRTVTKSTLQFFSVPLVHFSDQNWNSQHYLFDLHIIVLLVHSFSFLWISCFGTFMSMIMHNSLLFPTLSIAYVMLIKMYYNWSLLNRLTSHKIQELVQGCPISWSWSTGQSQRECR